MTFLKAAAVSISTLALAAPAWAFPDKPVQIVVPFAPGGAGDVFARVFVAAINDNNLLSQPIRIEGADLVIDSVSVPATANFGDTVPVTWTVG